MGNRGRNSKARTSSAAAPAGPAPGTAVASGTAPTAAIATALGQDGSKARIGRVATDGAGVEIRTFGTSLAPYGKKARRTIQAQRRAVVDGALKPLGFGVKWGDGGSDGRLVHI